MKTIAAQGPMPPRFRVDSNLSRIAASECSVFLWWCITTGRHTRAAQAQRDLEVEVNPMAPFADDAQNQIDQDLMQIENGMLCKGPQRQRLKEYKVALSRGYN